MAFPIPQFEDLIDSREHQFVFPSDSVEVPFCQSQKHSFSIPTKNNLLYDEDKPLYKTPQNSCILFLAQSQLDKSKIYALKVSKFVKRIRKEYEHYKRIGPNNFIIKCYDTWVQNGKGFLQLELATNGSIKNEFPNFSIQEIWQITAHISSALGHIHSTGHMHLDISPANILHTDDSEFGTIFKLSDFGTIVEIGKFEEDDEGAGPYVSPEALAFPHTEYEVNDKTDIFSFGLVLYELLTKKLVPREFPGYEALRNGTYKFTELPKEFLFVLKMLDIDPKRRPSAAEIMELAQCQKELNRFNSVDSGRMSPRIRVNQRDVSTPVMASVKVAPETPYSKKYTGRRLIFDDDDDFANQSDL